MPKTSFLSNKRFKSPTNQTEPWFSQKGFTLLEVIVVVSIIAAISGMAVLSMNFYTPGRKLNKAAERMHTVVRLLYDESILMGQEYGLMLYRDGYRILEWYEPEALPTTNNVDTNPGTSNTPNYATETQPKPISYWRMISSGQLGGEHSFPEEIELQASVEGVDLLLPTLSEQEDLFSGIVEQNSDGVTEINPAQVEQKKQALSKVQPPLLFLSSGESMDFTLTLSLSESPLDGYSIQGDIAGNLQFIKPGEPL